MLGHRPIAAAALASPGGTSVTVSAGVVLQWNWVPPLQGVVGTAVVPATSAFTLLFGASPVVFASAGFVAGIASAQRWVPAAEVRAINTTGIFGPIWVIPDQLF